MGENQLKQQLSSPELQHQPCHFTEERVNCVFMPFKNNYLLSPWRVTDNNNYSSRALFTCFPSEGLSANQPVQVWLRVPIIMFLPSNSLFSCKERGEMPPEVSEGVLPNNRSWFLSDVWNPGRRGENEANKGRIYPPASMNWDFFL